MSILDKLRNRRWRKIMSISEVLDLTYHSSSVRYAIRAAQEQGYRPSNMEKPCHPLLQQLTYSIANIIVAPTFPKRSLQLISAHSNTLTSQSADKQQQKRSLTRHEWSRMLYNSSNKQYWSPGKWWETFPAYISKQESAYINRGSEASTKASKQESCRIETTLLRKHSYTRTISIYLLSLPKP
jgi:hypothetical protein